MDYRRQTGRGAALARTHTCTHAYPQLLAADDVAMEAYSLYYSGQLAVSSRPVDMSP